MAMVDKAKDAQAAAVAAAPAGTAVPAPRRAGPVPMVDNPNDGALDNMAVAAFVLPAILLIVRYMKGFVASIPVLIGIVVGCVVAAALAR